MKTLAVIPARMGSSRFPGKPLEKIHGVPMVGHCYFRTRICKQLDEVIIATCDDEIMDYGASINAKAVMTSREHQRATDRTAEALLKIEKEYNTTFNVVVMVQGDEPMVTPEMIERSLEPFQNDKAVQVVNLMLPIEVQEEFEDPNEIKVVVDRMNNALYFSRQPIPSNKASTTKYKQVCIIPFQRDFLLQFNELPETNLERAESVDMLRILEHGGFVRMVESPNKTWSVDTREDLLRVEEKMSGDVLMQRYITKNSV